MSETNNVAHPTPSEKAWETARERAREQGQSVRDEEIRCIKSNGLSCWAKLLFWILSKICWETSHFLHNRRVGSVCITGRQLRMNFNFPEKRLYTQTKRTKDKEGKVVASRRCPGAIEELETAGLVWMSHKRIENIPASKWPNVFNIVTLVPQVIQESLPLLEGVAVVEDHTTNGGSSDFLAKNGRGSSQTPRAGVGHYQRGELPTPASGAPKETVRPKKDSLDLQTGESPPGLERQKWLSSLDGMYPSKLRKLRDDLKASFRAARKEEAKKVWQWRIDAVEERLLGGKVEDSPKPPEVVQVSTFSEETRQYLRDQAQHLINLGKGDQLTAAEREALR